MGQRSLVFLARGAERLLQSREAAGHGALSPRAWKSMLSRSIFLIFSQISAGVSGTGMAAAACGDEDRKRREQEQRSQVRH